MKTILDADGLRHTICKVDVLESITACGLSCGGVRGFDEDEAPVTCIGCLASTDPATQAGNFARREMNKALEGFVGQPSAMQTGTIIHEAVAKWLKANT